MGGGCGFLSRDLVGIDQPSVYDEIYQKDLAILTDSHGEDDLFTKFVTGPLLDLYHWFWQHLKVSLLIPLLAFCLDNGSCDIPGTTSS